MRIRGVAFGLVAGISALTFGAVTQASAEMFTCHDRPGQVLAVYNGSSSQYGSRSYSRRYSSDYSAQRPRPRYQAHVSYYSSRRSWNDRSRW